MIGFSLRKNTVFEWDQLLFRIERLTPNGDALLEAIGSGNFSVVPGAQLLNEYALGRISAKLAQSPTDRLRCPIFSRPIDELSDKTQHEVKRRQRYLEEIFGAGRPVFTKAHLDPIVKAVAEKIGDLRPPSTSTVYRWCRRYLRSGDARSLIPRHDLRGSRYPRQAERLMPLLQDALEEAYAMSPAATMDTIYTKLVQRISAENRISLSGPELLLPSRRTVYRLLHKVDAYSRSILRNGKRIADNKFRLVKIGPRTTDILERVEIDHTPLDLFLIDDQTWLPLGRPTLTAVVDHHSRMLLGYSLSFDHPSAAAVMAALRHAILPKTKSNQTLRDLRVVHPWPCYGQPDVLVVDNGLEFLGRDLEAVAFDLGFRLQFCPKRTPRFKGVVERYLKTVNYFFVHQLPGTSLAKWHLREDYDPQKQALLTLKEFKHIFEKWVLDIYAQKDHRGLKNSTPWKKWEEGCIRRPPELPPNIAALNQRIGLTTQRSLRPTGIELHGIQYSSEALAPILRKYGPGVSVRVLYTPEDLGEIQVWGPDEVEPVAIHAMDGAYAAGLSILQNKLIRKIAREEGSSLESRSELQEARSELTKFVEGLMTSRKHIDRRRAAKIRGLGNEDAIKPQVEPRRIPAPGIPHKKVEIATGSTAVIRPSIYPRFSLKRGRGEGHDN